MKAGFSSSLIVHVLVLGFGLVALKAPAPHEVSDAEALPVSIIPIESMTELMQGDKTSKVKTDKPAPKPAEKQPTVPDARNAGNNDIDLDDVPRPEAAPRKIETASAPKVEPQPKVAPEPVEAKPEPKLEEVAVAKPEPAPRPEPKAKPEPKPEPVAEPKPAEAKPEPKPAEPKPDPIAEAINAEPTPSENMDFPKELPRPESRPERPQQVAKADTKPAEKPAEKPVEKAAAKPAEKPAEKQNQTSAKDSASKTAKAPKQQDLESLLDEAKALVNKQKPAGGGAKRSDQTASVGSERRNSGAKLSVSEMDALRQRLASCWSIPAGIDDAELLKVSVRFRLDKSGELEGRPEVVRGGGSSGPARTAAESAVRAVGKCAPFNLPADKYETWAEVVVNFDPSDMLY